MPPSSFVLRPSSFVLRPSSSSSLSPISTFHNSQFDLFNLFLLLMMLVKNRIFINHIYYFVLLPGTQKHEYKPSLFGTHCPPFMHGWLMHAGPNISQVTPVNPGRQSHVNAVVVERHVALFRQGRDEQGSTTSHRSPVKPGGHLKDKHGRELFIYFNFHVISFSLFYTKLKVHSFENIETFPTII